MIATILTSSSTFNAVDYNERKVSQGLATLVEISNFGYLQASGNLSRNDLKQYLVDYSSRNSRIKNTQLHLAISCKAKEYSYEQLVDIAHQYLKEMGYGQEGQPLLIYEHHDTNNNHIHIVSSRVAPDGHKIDDHNERIRSQKVLNKIMGVDRKEETAKIIAKAKGYKFATVGQFRAIIESSGYETYEDNDTVNVKKDGQVVKHIPFPNIVQLCRQDKDGEEEKRRKQLKAILMKYRELVANKTQLAELLHTKFGMSLMFMGDKDKPYGYMLVDHHSKTVFKGSDVLPIKQLLNFSHAEINPKNVIDYIHKLLDENKALTLRELNKSLRRTFRALLKRDGTIAMGKQEFLLDADTLKSILYNDKVRWVQDFHPSSVSERDVLCSFYGLESQSEISIENPVSHEDKDYLANCVSQIMAASAEQNTEAFHALKDVGIFIFKTSDSLFAISSSTHTIVRLDNYGLTLDMLKQPRKHFENMARISAEQKFSQSHRHSSRNLSRVLKAGISSGHSDNREWEVGSGEDWDEEEHHKYHWSR